MGEFVRICEVGTRDGLQNEKANITTDDKKAMIDGLVASGLSCLELTSFVSSKAVPMMADADEIMAYTRNNHSDVKGMGLIFNERGYDRAKASGCDSVALVFVVSESLSETNTKRKPDDWIEKYKTLIPQMKADGIWVRAYLAAAWICPYDGQISPERVFKYADILWDLGVDELCPTDVIGQAHPVQVGSLLEDMGKRYDISKLAVHLHDTQSLGLANAYAAIQAGVRTLDTSVGGLGGCPFAPGSAGNLATEDLVLMLHKMGYETGVNLDKLWQIVYEIEPKFNRPLGGRSRAWYDGELTKKPV